MASSDTGYQNCIENSERVRWKVDDVLGTDGFDFSRPFMPESLAQVDGIGCLSDSEKLLLNQLRGLTYAHLFGFLEEFIIRKVQALAASYPIERLSQRRALLMFAEEEVKHQILFERTKVAITGKLGACGLVPGASDVAGFVLQKSEFCVLLLTSMLEWVTQQHFTDLFRASEEREKLDPIFVKIFKSHWLEEAQHGKLDQLEIARLAEVVPEPDRERAIDEVLEVGGALDGLLKAQIDLDLESLQRLAGRTFSPAEKEEIASKQQRAYRYTFLVTALSHPKFIEQVAMVAKGGVPKLAQAAAALSA